MLERKKLKSWSHRVFLLRYKRTCVHKKKVLPFTNFAPYCISEYQIKLCLETPYIYKYTYIGIFVCINILFEV